MHRLYTNTTPVYVRNLSFLRFCYLLRVGRSWNQLPIDMGEQLYAHIIVGESHKHREQKKQIAAYMLYNSIYVKFQNMINCAVCCL